jgi:uncharacterized protein (DUF2126 family)/transglutaminase-like putative cysteine protease
MTGIRVALNHVTHYRYDRPIALGMQTIRLRPAPHTHSVIEAYSLNILPKQHFINWQQDPFGNYLASIVFPEKVSEFRVEVDLLTEIRVFNPFDFFLEDYAKDFPFSYHADLKEELGPYLEIKENGPLLQQWLSTVNKQKRSVINFLVDINQLLNSTLRYVVRMEPGIHTSEESFAKASGSCRDMAWLLCQALRHLGFATRFVSGYLIQLKPDVRPEKGPAGPKEDFTDLHAWTEVYLPGAGWVGLDPTSGLFTGEEHIPLCCTPNPSSAAPITGTLEKCETTFSHTMSIERISETPRTTRPFTDAEWKQIDTLGAKIDTDLEKYDVRLTMGGEPTFVSAEDFNGDEWHFTALSPEKEKLGNRLLRSLQLRFAPGSLLQYCSGKWYPGEILPRWAMNCYWRADGEPIWQNNEWLANPEKQYDYTATTAETFLSELAERLGIPSSCILPAEEDVDYYAWKEKTLPLDDSAAELSAYEKAERARVKALRTKKKDEPTGYVLPLHFSYKRECWISNRWQFNGRGLTLIPGDSPLGLRLPLNSLPFVPLPKSEIYPERGTDKQKGGLPKYQALAKASEIRAKKTAEGKNTVFAKDPNGLIRSALCAEVRGGMLHLFLPPVHYIEHFLDLVATIETVAASLNIPVLLTGYSPPSDLRIHQFSVTPDPGVIEVNVQPAANWGELKQITETVYEEARKTKLTAEKFMLDGRRTGTGGGNHIVMGSATPENSPFLRRPDLLRSMVTFWQNHPALSYVFSGMYVGPTSQSPRIDEARHDSLYELEIAFRQISDETTPHQLDRLFRNLLIDLTGNTHRAEFCIDKLYSPDGRRGRLGLLEMRAFEMTPHPRMNLLQALLIRAAIAHFWTTPYTRELARWGTSLHDRFMLPYYLEQDLNDALHELKSSGYGFKPDWFKPFFIFRFPHYGTAQIGPVTLDLRMALEPWHVMGEEMHAGTISRSVDSSVERLQVVAKGMSGNRYVVTCNGHKIPLNATQEKDVSVAGVRFKAWAPASSLHPNLPVNSPLVFDVIDMYSNRSIGGCTYHVIHPGGRSYETIPVNPNEAEGRLLSRFEAMGHTPGKAKIIENDINPDFPYTLDLRMKNK